MVTIEEAIETAVLRAKAWLAHYIGEPSRGIVSGLLPGPEGPDFLLPIGKHQFLIEIKSSSDVASVSRGIEQLSLYSRELTVDHVPLLVVPFMGEAGAKRCAEADVSWLDLSGNAKVAAPGLAIHVEGKPNQFKRRGRPYSVFAAKSSRIVRWLLMHENTEITRTQRELARLTGMDEGFTSRILRNLEQSGYISRDPKGGRVRVIEYDLLLDAWHAEYRFDAHRIIRGHVTEKSGAELQKSLARRLDERQVEYAVTGLGAAWLLSRFAAFRLATFYLRQFPDDQLLDDLGIWRTDQGENLWLVLPNDEGVFHNAGRGQEVVSVAPIQIYLDLKGHPERATEAAAQLRLQTRMARELRAYEHPKDILERYRDRGVTEENIRFITEVIENGVQYFPPIKKFEDV